jgi:hypothetical protein
MPLLEPHMVRVYLVPSRLDRFCLHFERNAFILGAGLFFGNMLGTLILGGNSWSMLALSVALIIYGIWRPTFRKLNIPRNAHWMKP